MIAGRAKLQASTWGSAHCKLRMTMVGLRQARSLMMHKREIELLAVTKKMKQGWITKIRAFLVLREHRAATLLVDATYIGLSQRLAFQRLIRLEAQVLESWSRHRYALKTRRSRLSTRTRVHHWRLLSRVFEAYQLQTCMHQSQRLRLQTWAHKRSFKTSSRSFGILRKYTQARKQQIKLFCIVETRHRTRLEHVIFENWAHVAHARKSRNRRLGNAHIKSCLKHCVPYFENWTAVMHHRRLKARSLHRLVRTRGLTLIAPVFKVWRYSKTEQHDKMANITRCGDRRLHRLLVAVIRTLWQMAAINVQVRRLLTRRARRNMIESLRMLRKCVHVRRRLNQIFSRHLLRHKRRTLQALSRYVIDKRRLFRISGGKRRHFQLNVLKSLHQYVHMRKKMRRLHIAYVFCLRPLLLTGMRSLELEACANSWARAAKTVVLLRCRRERWIKRWVILVFRDQKLRNQLRDLEIVHKTNQRGSLRQPGDQRNTFQVWAETIHILKHQQRVIRRVRAAVNTVLVRSIWRMWYRAHARMKRHKLSLSRLDAVLMRNERRTMCHVLDILYARTSIVRGRTRANQQAVARLLELLSTVWVYWLSVKVRRRRLVNLVKRAERSEMWRGWYWWVYFIRWQRMVKRARHSRSRKLLRLCFNLLSCERCVLEGRLRDMQRTEQQLNDSVREAVRESVKNLREDALGSADHAQRALGVEEAVVPLADFVEQEADMGAAISGGGLSTAEEAMSFSDSMAVVVQESSVEKAPAENATPQDNWFGSIFQTSPVAIAHPSLPDEISGPKFNVASPSFEIPAIEMPMMPAEPTFDMLAVPAMFGFGGGHTKIGNEVRAIAGTSEEGSVDIAKNRMRHAELHGRVGEGDAAAAALEEEKTEHSDTQRDAMSMLDRARGEQRELVQAHTRAEEQHSMDAQELKRLGAERTAEDRIEKHHQQQRSEDDTSCSSSSTHSCTLHKVQERVQELEHEIMDLNAEHQRELDRMCSDLQRAAKQEKEKYVSERREAESKLAAAHRAELDDLEQALSAQDNGEVEKLRALLREEEHKSGTQVAALEEVNRETLSRTENAWCRKMQAGEANDCKARVDKSLAEAAQCNWLVATLEKDVSDVKLAAQFEAQRLQGELKKHISTLRAQHSDELAQMHDTLARCAAKAEQVKAKSLNPKSQALK